MSREHAEWKTLYRRGRTQPRATRSVHEQHLWWIKVRDRGLTVGTWLKLGHLMPEIVEVIRREFAPRTTPN